MESELGAAWSVYYSRPWWGISDRGAELDGEADFVVSHPDKGVLFIEVKGGRVEHDPANDSWTSMDRDGIRHRIKNPLQQAVAAKHRLLAKFRGAVGWPSHRVRVRHGVIFPGCEAAAGAMGLDQPLICGATEFRDGFTGWIEARLASHVEPSREFEHGPGQAGIQAIDATIAAPVRLTVPLHRELQSNIERQDELLTGAQLLAVCSIESFSRVVIEGGAGTGKTVIACEIAARHARSGRATLLTCLSEPLALSLRRRMAHITGLDVLSCADVETAVRRGTLGLYQAVIVDEGQDIRMDRWDLLQRLVGKGGVLRVLFDSNQAVYQARDDLETRLQAKAFPLRLNLRNTKRIAALTEKLYRGPLIDCVGPEGQQVSIHAVEKDVAPEAAAALASELLGKHQIAPADVAVLVPDAAMAATVANELGRRGIRVSNAETRDAGAVVVETIPRFKGMESMCAILIADRISANNKEVCYVGVSRARALLLVVIASMGTELGEALQHSSEPRRI
jgi:hypothetical protein